MTSRFVGQRVARREDARFLTGRGRYVDDVALPEMVHAAFCRSDVARGRIVSVDATEAMAIPGITAVFVATDLNPLVHDFLVDGEAALGGHRPFRLLADDDVRYAGEPVAMV